MPITQLIRLPRSVGKALVLSSARTVGISFEKLRGPGGADLSQGTASGSQSLRGQYTGINSLLIDRSPVDQQTSIRPCCMRTLML